MPSKIHWQSNSISGNSLEIDNKNLSFESPNINNNEKSKNSI